VEGGLKKRKTRVALGNRGFFLVPDPDWLLGDDLHDALAPGFAPGAIGGSGRLAALHRYQNGGA